MGTSMVMGLGWGCVCRGSCLRRNDGGGEGDAAQWGGVAGRIPWSGVRGEEGENMSWSPDGVARMRFAVSDAVFVCEAEHFEETGTPVQGLRRVRGRPFP